MNISQLLPAKYARYNKAIVAFLGSVVAYLVFAYGDAAWVAGVVQLATVLGVYHVNNSK